MLIISVSGYQYTKKEITEGLHREMMFHAQETSLVLNQLFIKERALAQGVAAVTEDVLSEVYYSRISLPVPWSTILHLSGSQSERISSLRKGCRCSAGTTG